MEIRPNVPSAPNAARLPTEPNPPASGDPNEPPDETLAQLVLSVGDRRGRRRGWAPLTPLAMRRELARLEADIGLCDRCFGYEARWVTRFQRPAGTARILLIGERAPRALLESQGRLGLDSEDDASRNLRELVEHAALPLEECVVAASILCRPRSRALESVVPDRACRRACAVHVRSIVLALRPRLIVPMGRSALESLRHAFPTLDSVRSLRFPSSVGQATKAGDTFIHPVFLPTRRARVHRSAEVQREDWGAIGRLWRQLREAEGGPGLGGAEPD